MLRLIFLIFLHFSLIPLFLDLIQLIYITGFYTEKLIFFSTSYLQFSLAKAYFLYGIQWNPKFLLTLKVVHDIMIFFQTQQLRKSRGDAISTMFELPNVDLMNICLFLGSLGYGKIQLFFGILYWYLINWVEMSLSLFAVRNQWYKNGKSSLI